MSKPLPPLSSALVLLVQALPAQDAAGIGVLEPVADVTVLSRVDGYVSRLFVRPGDSVKALDKLVTLSAPDLQAEVGRATAALAQEEDQMRIHETELEIAKKRLSIAEREVKQAAEELPKTAELLATREQELSVAEKLFESGRLNSQDVSETRIAAMEARTARFNAGERVKNAQDQVEIRRLELALAQTSMARQRSRINEMRAVLEQAKIRAGFAEIANVLPEAVVAEVEVSPGSLVRAGETPILRLIVVHRLQVEVPLPLRAAAQVAPGDPVRISVPGDQDLQAKVTRIGPTVDVKTGTVPVVVEFDNPERRLRPGTAVEVDFHPQ